MIQICFDVDKTNGNPHAFRDTGGRFLRGNQFGRRDRSGLAASADNGSVPNVGRVKRSATRRGGNDGSGDVDASSLADETLAGGGTFDRDSDVRRDELAGSAGTEGLDRGNDVRRATDGGFALRSYPPYEREDHPPRKLARPRLHR